MGTRFEKFSEPQLKKYLGFVHKVLKDKELGEPEEFFNLFSRYDKSNTKQILQAPLGWEFERLDIEYLYFLLKNNPFYYVEDKELNRPTLEYKDCDFVTDEKVRIQYTRSGQVDTYLDDDFNSSYLEELRQHNEIAPWDWEITDEDHRDGEVYDDWFDVN